MMLGHVMDEDIGKRGNYAVATYMSLAKSQRGLGCYYWYGPSNKIENILLERLFMLAYIKNYLQSRIFKG